MSIKTKTLQKTFFLFLIATSLVGDTELESEFLSLLDEVSTIATKTKVNIDQQPSTISILTKENLKKKGFKNIHEALSTIPGFEGYISNLGWKALSVRGVYTANAYGFDKITLLVDGVNVNNTLYGTVYYYLDFPIEIVERIEVLRGPGSILYGSGAYSGVINIITKKDIIDKNLLFSSMDSYGFISGGTKLFTAIEDIDLQIDAYYQKDDKRLDVDTRRNAQASWLDGQTSEFLRDYSFGIMGKKENFSFTSRVKRSKSGDYYGSSEYELGVSKDNGYKNSIFFFQGEYQDEYNFGKISIKAGYKKYSLNSLLKSEPREKLIEDTKHDVLKYLQQKSDTQIAKALIDTYKIDSFIEENFYTDSILGYKAKEEKLYTEISLEKKIENHLFIAGLEHSLSKNLSNSAARNFYNKNELITTFTQILDNQDPNSLDLMYPHTIYETDGFIGTHRERTVNSLYIQDLIALNTKSDLRVGYRLDKYSDLSTTPTSYSIGLVHRLKENINFKISHGFSYRSPSFVELYTSNASNTREGNTQLKPEGIQTTEISALYIPNLQTRIQTTFFRSLLKNAIDLSIDCNDLTNEEKNYIPCSTTGTYWNYKERRVKGVEFELKHELNTQNTFAFNYTYLDTLAKGWQPYFTVKTQQNIPLSDIAHELVNLSHTYFFNKGLSFNTFVQYTAARVQNSKENKIDGNIQLNETVNYRFSPTTFLQFSLKNILNDRKQYPSSWSFHDEGLKREERSFAFKVAVEF